jgi:hypothetical protein
VPDFEITAPDGRKFRVSGPGTREDALAQVQAKYQPQVAQPYAGPMARPAGQAQPYTGPMARPKSQTAATMERLGFVGPTQEQAGIPRINPQMASPIDALKGVADVAVSGFRGLVNKPAATLMGLKGALDPNDTYIGARDRYRDAVGTDQLLVKDDRLRSPQGEIVANAVGNFPGIRHAGQAINWAGQKVEDIAGPEARDAVESATMLGTLGRAPRSIAAARRPALTAEEAAARATAGDSVGAAAAAVDLSGITPEMRQAIIRTGGRGINREALARHAEADSLPVPIRLTAGEATQDIVRISNERNLRGKHPEMAQRMDETNRALGQNMQALRDDVGQNVFTTNAVEHGDTLIAAYRAKDAAAEANINALYKQMRDSFGSGVPIDARAILKGSTAALHEALLFDHAPPEIMRALTRLADSRSMTFENFEALRTNLARIQRSNADGNVKAAAGIIRNELENLPIFPGSGAERMKPLADAARAAARRRFQELEADPAYDAAVNGTVPADRFVQKFVIGAPRDQLARLVQTFRNDPNVRSTISVAALDHLRDAARLDPGYAGNFSADGFSRALQALDPKANIIFDARTTETLSRLRNVARYTTFQPRGSFVNNSNTLVGSLAKPVVQAAEGTANFMAGGIPVGTWTRQLAERSGSRRMIRNSLARGAGLTSPPPKNSLNRP